jgi:phosphoglycolate phosphatase
MSAPVETGVGEAADFVAAVEAELTAALGFRPFPGTLNLQRLPVIEDLPERTLTDGNLSNEHCDGVVVSPCNVAGLRAAVLRPLMQDYPESKVEVIAPVQVRALFGLEDGDTVPVGPREEVWHHDGPTADPGGLDEFDAVVFDLDGTLVDLDVDWPTVHEKVVDLLGDVMDGPLSDYTRPEIIRLSREVGRYEELDRLLTEYEADGAETAPRLPLLDVVADLDCPVGVCTANAMSAAERALSQYRLRDAVDVIVARGTVEEEKPHPRPLYESLASVGVAPGDAVFVGDERSDATTAAAAGSSFLHTGQF